MLHDVGPTTSLDCSLLDLIGEKGHCRLFSYKYILIFSLVGHTYGYKLAILFTLIFGGRTSVFSANLRRLEMYDYQLSLKMR